MNSINPDFYLNVVKCMLPRPTPKSYKKLVDSDGGHLPIIHVKLECFE
ncbi:MAG: hypothetical protein IKF11_10145 [Methanobrevibacter sp.]|nr:hypothetical protein [Methanobrevibacter sp.]